ncbi:MAG: hypothetical protein HOK71_09660 [Planctomycetaceae bacterium]|jgi:hypothetical protein|nr:hypothetical protein [Planctomycetaceae bacterium]MBT6484925.1 hypothetical protein [Planctomycetaceae bacterium]
MFDSRPQLADDFLLEDCAALEYILLGDLRDLLEESPDEENCRWLLVILDALLEAKQREFELQQDGGYLEDVLEQVPNWEPQVERLRHEHHELFDNLRQLRERVGSRQSFDAVADTVRADLRDWMTLLQRHHRHTRRIVQSAFNFDIGVGD